MRHLYLYVSDEIAETAKAKARAARKSLSRYLTGLVVRDVASTWPEGFFEEVVGGWKTEPRERPPSTIRRRGAS